MAAAHVSPEAPAPADPEVSGVLLYLRAAEPLSAYVHDGAPPAEEGRETAGLPASEALLRKVIDHVPVLLYVLDREIKHGPDDYTHGPETYQHKGERVSPLEGLEKKSS